MKGQILDKEHLWHKASSGIWHRLSKDGYYMCNQSIMILTPTKFPGLPPGRKCIICLRKR